MSGSSPTQQPETLDLPALRNLCVQLGHWAFTDFRQAREALDVLAQHITPETSFDVRLAYHRHNGFLQNQWQHYSEALEHLDKAAAILESLSDNIQLAEIWTDKAAVHLNRRDWNKAQECLDNARPLLKGPHTKRLRGHIACREGFLHLYLRNDRPALNQLTEAKRIFDALGENRGLKEQYAYTLVLSGLGDLYERLDDKESSLDAYRQVLPIMEEYCLRPRLAWHYLNAGRAALAQQDANEAQQHFENAAIAADEGDLEAKSYALANLGILAFINGKTLESAKLFDEALALFQDPDKPSDFTNRAKLEAWLAGLLMQQN
ncbi:MAG: hypothetical protein R2792_00050 [Saprospiraceae bacterium]